MKKEDNGKELDKSEVKGYEEEEEKQGREI